MNNINYCYNGIIASIFYGKLYHNKKIKNDQNIKQSSKAIKYEYIKKIITRMATTNVSVPKIILTEF